MPPIPTPKAWILWALALACAVCFAVALACPRPAPVDPAQLTHATATRIQAVAVKDSVQSRVKTAHARSEIQVKQLAPLRKRVTLTPNAVIVDGNDTLSGVGVGVVGKVIAQQDTVIDRLRAESEVKDTAIVAGESALAASEHETQVAVSLIPSQWSRVKTATKWSLIGGGAALTLRALLHALKVIG